MYDARVLADSTNPQGERLLTVLATFPRFILAELNTHRVFSRNSASSRAIPTEKMIERVESNPFVPETFNQRVKGMGVGTEVSDDEREECIAIWLEARDAAVDAARGLNYVGIDKSRANRLLEPFMWHTAIVTSTEWSNFFNLRCPPGNSPDIQFPAQLEFQRIAIMMRHVMYKSVTRFLEDHDDWHLPLVSRQEMSEADVDVEMLRGWQKDYYWPMISAGRCARVSYDTHENSEPLYASIERAGKLMNAGHMSPFEHQARPIRVGEGDNFNGNLNGKWAQFRKLIPCEWDVMSYSEDARSAWQIEAREADAEVA